MSDFKFHIDQINQKTFADPAKVEEIEKRLGIDTFEPKITANDEEANLKLTATNTKEYYEGYAFMKPVYVPKILKWLKKGKYTYQITPSGKLELKLKIIGFELLKVKKSDTEMLKEEV
jgi:hypothetical protein